MGAANDSRHPKNVPEQRNSPQINSNKPQIKSKSIIR